MLGARSFDQDFDTLDKSLVASVQKALNATEAPVKEKHARVIIIASHKDKSTTAYWSLTRRLPLQENPIMAWKYCHVSHKLLRDGHQSVLKDCQASLTSIQDLGRLWGHLREGYGSLIALYCRLLLQKISFHRKNPQMPGSMVVNDEDFNKMCAHSMDEYFELSVDMLDYMDHILKLQLQIFNSLDQCRSNSMTSGGQCKLAPLLPCVLDSSQLYHYLVHILFKLHSALPADTLQGHRERFISQYNLLKKFFRNASNLQYFKNLIKVPQLPDSLPNFLKAYELNSHVRPEVLVAEVDEEEVRSIAGDVVDTQEELAKMKALLREKDDLLGRLEGDLRAGEGELERVRKEDQVVLQSMRCKVVEMEAEADIQRRISESTTHENELLKNVLKQKCDLEAQATLGKSDLEKAAKANEDKFSRMKDIYAKLREEHVAVLKKFSDSCKQVTALKKEKDDLEGSQKEAERQRIECEVLQRSTENDKLMESLEARNKDLVAEVDGLKVGMLKKEEEEEERKKKMDREIAALREGEKVLEGRVVEVEKEKSELELKMVEMVKMKGKAEDREGGMTERYKEIEKRMNEGEEAMKEKTKEFADLIERLRGVEEGRMTERKEMEGKVADREASLEGCKKELEEVQASCRRTEERMNEEMRLMKDNIFKSLQTTTSELVHQTLQDSTHEFFADVKCSAEYCQEQLAATRATFNKFSSQGLLYLQQHHDFPAILRLMDEFTHSFTHSLNLSFATTHAAPPLAGEALSSSCNQLGEEVIKLLKCQNEDDFAKQSLVVEGGFARVQKGVEGLLSKGQDVGHVADLIEEEMKNATLIVQQAADKLAKLLQSNKETHSGVRLEVNEKIIDSCNALMMCIRKLIEASKELQREIVSQGRGTYSIVDFYKKHHRWTDGLISAAKSVGLGAKVLLDAADKVVSRKGKFEELMVCAQEIAASTAQLVVASRVKADRHSDNLQTLTDASKAVSEATGAVVGAAKLGAERVDEEVLDFSQLSLHQAKRSEMDSQVRVLELESGLEKERRRLAELRKKHYQLAAEVEEAAESGGVV